MNNTTALVIALGILALVVVAFFAVFRGKGKFSIKSKLGEASAEGENPTVVAAGVKIGSARAGETLRAHSSAVGGVELGQAEAKNIDATHAPGHSPPKS